ncbi:hypothetical protein BTVI_47273 [Pitangus sulphuratus]|nr:hypothetical protein BTVI_47273 [Pitangus sulphuratus]
MIARALLTVIQYSTFESEWKAMIKKHAKENTDQRGIPIVQTVDRYYGEGAYASNAEKTRINKEQLYLTKGLALTALREVANASTPSPSYALVYQGLKEPFIDFTTRLREAISRQIPDQGSQDVLFKSLVVEKVNEECQRVLWPLRNAPLLEMIQACRNVGSQTSKIKMLAAVLKSPQKCFNCGDDEHFQKNCPKTNPKSSIPPYDCTYCGKGMKEEGLIENTFAVVSPYPPIFLEVYDDIPVMLSLNQLANSPLKSKAQVHWAQPISVQRPIITCTVFSSTVSETTQIPGLLDTGVDVTIISMKDWPSHWPFGTTKISANAIRQHSFFITHIRSHSTLPGPIPEGNRHADLLAENCNPDVYIWETTSNFFAASKIPAIRVNRALSILTHMACWMEKEANATSIDIGLLVDSLKLKKSLYKTELLLIFFY